MSPSTSYLNGPSTSSHTLNGHGSASKLANGAGKGKMDELEACQVANNRLTWARVKDMDCPLCLEEMDLSDLTFRPCPCGYQICRFCWHNIKENLNGRCPACRREYDEQPSQFKAMSADELKRLQNLKKQKEKQKKDLELLNRKNLANVRVKQKCQVHIQGYTARFANEDGPEQFGQYGKIAKLFMSKRSATSSTSSSRDNFHPLNQQVHVYINFTRPVDAAACISAVDGTTTPDGQRLKASWGTTKYCSTWLKGGRCQNENCVQAHELGEEVGNDKSEEGIKAREEMSAVRHALKESEHRGRASVDIKKGKEGMFVSPQFSRMGLEGKGLVTLPPTAAWASKTGSQPTTPTVASAPPPTAQPPKRMHPAPIKHPLPARPKSRQSSLDKSSPAPAPPLPPPPASQTRRKRKRRFLPLFLRLLRLRSLPLHLLLLFPRLHRR
ncbi:hypothetical protein BT69DRAFT_281840 [Atractiella rhizophila]|nr:hypothetical protein BT69DRAFT_281840 [Atractiella rhizophila]